MKNKVKTEFDPEKLMKIIDPQRLKILKALDKETKINQLKIKEKLNLSSYRQTCRHIAALKKAGLIKKKVKKKERGSPVFISLK